MSVSVRAERLDLEPLSAASVAAVLGPRRGADWAEDFPTEGDTLIARGSADASDPAATYPWCHYHLRERSSGQLVGGIGFHHPPQEGVVEIGYGVAPSRQRRGYATEAVNALVEVAFAHGAAAVVATVDADNVASRRVLEKAGFALVEGQPAPHYRLERPGGGRRAAR